MLTSRRFQSLFCRLGGVALAALALGACAAPTEGPEATQEPEHTAATGQALTAFSVTAYENALVKALKDAKGMGGYSYAIYQNGTLLRSNGAGYARVSPAVPFTADTPFSMMSTGKTITAAAMVKLLAERDDISLSTPVKNYLPLGWVPDQNFDVVTFRHLMSHSSGLEKSRDSWDGIKYEVENRVAAPGGTIWDGTKSIPVGVGTYYYSNTNFTLDRVMLAYMLDKTMANIMQDLGMGPSYTAQVYRNHVLANIFQPLGLDSTKVDVQPIGAYPAGYYNATGTQVHFDPTDGSSILNSGAGYWTLSVKSYGKFIDALSHGKYAIVNSGTTLDPWKFMTTMVPTTNNPNVGLGLFRQTGAHGDYYWHDGGWGNDVVGACSEWMTYPNGMSVVWNYNSGIPDGQGGMMCPVLNATKMMADAYDNAFITVVNPILL